MKKVIIYPGGDISYQSFYIYGLEKMFGKMNISYSSKPFHELHLETWAKCKDIFFVIIDEHNHVKRYFISCNDSYQVHDDVWQWTDVYGSVNANFEHTDESYWSKMVSLCPSFGIRCWSYPMTMVHTLYNNMAHYGTLRHCVGRHLAMMRRQRYETYNSMSNQSVEFLNSIFFLSTLWYNDEWNKNDEGVNKARANFIRASQKVANETTLSFEGGFVSQGEGRSSVQLFQDCMYHSLTMDEWLSKTQNSLLVFNTPAFWNCHGWKLGEYMAMGQCIVSTILSNDLPSPLNHGEHIHFVENSEEAMLDAIKYIYSHPEYNQKLRRNIKEYWEKYGTPIASLKLLGITN